jgi:FlaG/FlaF family flagellin (archaellin)
VTPTVGVALLLLVTVVLAAGVGTLVLSTDPPAPPPQAALSLSVEGDRLILTHRAGDPLDVRTLDLRVSVGGEPLTHQPPVLFFAAAGFAPGPTGAFNAASGPTWRAGGTTSVTLAATNEPLPTPGDRVTVTVVVDGYRVAVLSATAS